MDGHKFDEFLFPTSGEEELWARGCFIYTKKHICGIDQADCNRGKGKRLLTEKYLYLLLMLKKTTQQLIG